MVDEDRGHGLPEGEGPTLAGSSLRRTCAGIHGARLGSAASAGKALAGAGQPAERLVWNRLWYSDGVIPYRETNARRSDTGER
ncbi:hypothetical protein GCM10010988_03170 [Cnuibacter physcomitrellae]|nr:hypothetical protein GCM10010988_03170 [Cnuibacter physcomitrellae]